MNELFKKTDERRAAKSRASTASSHAQRGERTSTVLACCPLGDLVFGLDSKVVESITDVQSGDRVDDDCLDLAARYGVALGPVDRRRCLTLRRGELVRRCLVGSEIMVREFEGALSPLPTFLDGLHTAAALRGYFAWPRGYVFVLDLDAIFARSSQ